MRILHIDCSIRNDQSVSKQLSRLLVSQLSGKFKEADIDYLDLSIEPPAHPSALFIKGNYTAPGERTKEMTEELTISEALVERMHRAEIYVIGMPMYNFSIPSNFKAFIDNVVRIGRTFLITESGFQGLLTDKKVFVVNTRGADFALIPPSMDLLKPYLKTIFGFMGLEDITFIDVHPVQFASGEARIKAIEKATIEISNEVGKL